MESPEEQSQRSAFLARLGASDPRRGGRGLPRTSSRTATFRRRRRPPSPAALAACTSISLDKDAINGAARSLKEDEYRIRGSEAGAALKRRGR